MPFSDYFNYFSTFSTVTVLVGLLILIPVGLFLCKYNLKFIAVSVVGLILTTVYLSQSIMLVVNFLKDMGHSTVGLILEYALPVVFFLGATFGIIRWGLQIWLNRIQNKQISTLSPPLPGKVTFQERRRKFLHWFTTREGISICLIQAAVLAVHLIYIGQPTVPEVLDEGYYFPEAIRFLIGQTMSLPQHPPLGKWLIASGIYLFGDNWRAIPILFGVISIFIFYFICKKLTVKWSQGGTFTPLLATFLLATENLTFVIGHIAMLDVFYVTFMLLGFLLYLRGNYVWCGAAMGLSLLCKGTAILGVVAIILHWAVTHRSELAEEIRNTWKALQGRDMTGTISGNVLSMFKLLVTAVAVWLILVVPLEYPAMHMYPATTQWYNPLFRAIYMVWHPLQETYTGLASGSVTGGSMRDLGTPWQWLLSPGTSNVDLAPGPNAPRYLSSIGWTIWPLIIPSIVYLIYESVRNRPKEQNMAFFLLCWLVGVYGLLVIIQLVTGRLMYEYYFYPAIPAVCLAIAWGIWRLWGVAQRRSQTRVIFLSLLALYLIGTAITFVIVSPLGTNLVKLPL